jgi:hypothetical protein
VAALPSPTRAQAQSPAKFPLPARERSAHADRVVLLPTAQTQPAGTLFLTDYEVVVPSVGYALSDAVQIAATGASDLSELVFVDLSLKGSLLRSRYLQLAAAASIDYARGEDEELPFGRATLVAQLCADDGCRSSVSLGATLIAHDAPDTILPLGLGIGFIGHVSEYVDVLLECSGVTDAGAGIDLIDLPLYLVAYGARITGNRHWALDVTLLRPMQADAELRTGTPELFELLGVPFLAFTYRFRT